MKRIDPDEDQQNLLVLRVLSIAVWTVLALVAVATAIIVYGKVIG